MRHNVGTEAQYFAYADFFRALFRCKRSQPEIPRQLMTTANVVKKLVVIHKLKFEIARPKSQLFYECLLGTFFASCCAQVH
jgi:hypothetical protein